MTSDAIVTALRERLAFFVTDDSGERIVYGSEAGVLAALTPVVERLLAEQEKCIGVAVEQRDIIATKCDEAERRLKEIREHVETRLELVEGTTMAVELDGVLALLDTGVGQGEINGQGWRQTAFSGASGG